MRAQNFQQDGGIPTRVNGTSWWGATIVGLIVAVSVLFTGMTNANALAPVLFMMLMIGNYMYTAPKGRFIDRANASKSVLGYVGFAILFFFLIFWAKITVTAMTALLLCALITGIYSFALVKFLLPSLQQSSNPS